MKSRPGFALAAALMAMVVIAVLVTGALFASSQETHASTAEILEARAAGYAERAVMGRVAGWNAGVCDSLAVGGVIMETPAADPPLESSLYITRLDSAVFLIVGEGRIASLNGVTRIRRRIGVLVSTTRDAQNSIRVKRVSEQAWAAIYTM
jgi:type II secretory pathway pseudopilin PulG